MIYFMFDLIITNFDKSDTIIYDGTIDVFDASFRNISSLSLKSGRVFLNVLIF